MAGEKKSAIAAAEQIDGWTTPVELSLLYDLARGANGPIAEIGSWRGRSTAAIARGSMDGNKSTVYAIDSFVGVPPADRPTARGMKPGWNSSDAKTLRANLDSAGVNGLVTIVPKASSEAVDDVPSDCSLLFIDGAHDYDSVKRDLELYSPRVREKGFLAMHDCERSDIDVIKAADEILTADHARWRPRWRSGSIVVWERRTSQRHKIILGFPGSMLHYDVAMELLARCSIGLHEIRPERSGIGWDDMNRLWVHSLNLATRGIVTHFAMLHSDITPSPGWVDLLSDELDDHDADMISAAVSLKDDSGVTSCGIGDKDDPWTPFRRFTVRELQNMPETFSIDDTPHKGRYLLHNSGCLLIDLRKRVWRKTNPDGTLIATFSFPIQARLQPNGLFVHERESEDWYFSRKIAELGAKTLSTRRVATVHIGQKGYRNDYAWGAEHDEATKAKWEKEIEPSQAT